MITKCRWTLALLLTLTQPVFTFVIGFTSSIWFSNGFENKTAMIHPNIANSRLATIHKPFGQPLD